MSIASVEERLRTHPDDREAWLVFGDWLTEHGDPRGALVRRHVAGEGAAGTDRERAAWSRGAPSRSLDWRCGFVVGITVPFTADALDALDGWLRAPEARLVSAVAVLRGMGEDGAIGDDDDDDDDDDGFDDYDPDAPPDLAGSPPPRSRGSRRWTSARSAH